MRRSGLYFPAGRFYKGRVITSVIDLAEPATLIDLAGKTPLIATVQDCVRHFAALKATHQAEARILLTRPVHREGQKTRVWLLNPGEIAALAVTLVAMRDGRSN